MFQQQWLLWFTLRRRRGLNQVDQTQQVYHYTKQNRNTHTWATKHANTHTFQGDTHTGVHHILAAVSTVCNKHDQQQNTVRPGYMLTVRSHTWCRFARGMVHLPFMQPMRRRPSQQHTSYPGHPTERPC